MPCKTLEQWLAWQESLHPKKIDLGLARIKKVHAALAAPDRMTPFTVTITGTNGKGSCVALLEAILRAQGYRVGAYTSPHLLRFNERIRIDGEPADDDRICDAFERIDAARGDTSLSYFEFATLAALDLFGKAALDIQLLEVGLGGRLDAVNIIDPEVAVIATIGIDHSYWLGDTRDSIAVEKAGIFREGMPAVVGDPDPPLALLRIAEEKKVRLACFGRDFTFSKNLDGWTWHGAHRSLPNLAFPALRGWYQFQNASTVLQALELVAEKRPVSEYAIRIGLETVRLPGRLQLIPGEVPVILDVAHNPQAAQCLARCLQEEYPNKRIHAVFSIMRDKDMRGVILNMRPLVDRWFLAPLTTPRAASDDQLKEIFNDCSIARVSRGFGTAREALAAAKAAARPDDLILVFGSFYLVADCLALLRPGTA